jgi:hypothetical protein
LNPGSKVGDHPPAESPNAIKTLIAGSEHGWPPVWEIKVNVFRFFEECKTEVAKPSLPANLVKCYLENSVDGKAFSKYKFIHH